MENLKKLFIFFLLLFLIFFFLFNWKDLSLPFSSQNKEKKIDLPIVALPEIELAKEPSEKKGFLEIKKIEVFAPIIFVEGKDLKEFEEGLKKGVVHYPLSNFPGEKGKTIILGHSAPKNWPEINYDHIFDKISDLQKGDEILIKFNQREYLYQVLKQEISFPKSEKDILGEKTDDSLLILITCFPAGKDFKRVYLTAQLIK